MEKSAAVALALVLFLFCTQHQYQWAAMAQVQCLLPEHTRPFYQSFTAPIMNQTKLDDVGSVCAQGRGSEFSGCCRYIHDWVNLTCACSPGSGLVVPQSILTSAFTFCRVPIPQVGQCQGHCGSNASHFQELEQNCQPLTFDRPDFEGIPASLKTLDCCHNLQDLDFDCLCSPTSPVVLSRTILSAIALCEIPVPQTGQCRRLITAEGNCNLVTPNDFTQIEPTCIEQDFRIFRRGRINFPEEASCCRGLAAVLNSTCLCSPYVGNRIPEIPAFVASRCNILPPPSEALAICPGTCGVLTHDLHEMVPTTCHPFTPNCCTKLRALNFTCLCSPASQPQLIIPPALLTAASMCDIPVPKIGQCRPPTQGNCRVVTSKDFEQIGAVCGNATGAPSDIARVMFKNCCNGAAALFNTTSCQCSMSSGMDVPFKIRDIVSRRCKRPGIRLPRRLEQCPAPVAMPPVVVPPVVAPEAVPSVVEPVASPAGAALENCSRVTGLTPEELEPLVSLCTVNVSSSGSPFVNDRCCTGVTFWSNLTCLCSPLSERATPDTILIAATRFCNVTNVPQLLPQCPGN